MHCTALPVIAFTHKLVTFAAKLSNLSAETQKTSLDSLTMIGMSAIVAALWTCPSA